MPLSSAKLAVFYHQLAQQLGAGLTLSQALAMPSPAPAADARRLAALAEQGHSVATLLTEAGSWLPASDRPFLAAAAEAGRLPRVLAHLAERHGQLAATRRRVLLACAYPVFVFHFGALIFPFLRMIDFEHGLRGGFGAYLGGLAQILLPVWGAAALLVWLIRRENPLALRLLGLLPAIGGYRREQALADFAFGLGQLLDAGAPIGSAWREAGRLARSPRLHAATETIVARINQGLAPGSALAATGVFPPAFVARYQTGEATGGLEQALLSLAVEHQGAANQRLTVASLLYPGLLFGAVALMVVIFVLQFYLGYFAAITRMAE